MKSLLSLTFFLSFILTFSVVAEELDDLNIFTASNQKTALENDTLFEEYFTDSIPGDWTQVKYHYQSNSWEHYQNSWTCISMPNSDCHFAAAYDMYNYYYNVGLFTSAIDISNSGLVLFDFDRNFIKGFYQDTAMVRIYSGGVDSIYRVDTLWLQAVSDPDEGAHATFSLEPENYSDPSNIYIEFYLNESLFSGARFAIDNIVVKETDFGYLEGYVYDSAQNPVASVEVGIKAINKKVFTDANGHYNFGRIPVGTPEVYAKATGIGIKTEEVAITANQTTVHDFTIYRSHLSIVPDVVIDTLNPNEIYTDTLMLVNNGLGDANWSVDPGNPVDWFSVSQTEGVTGTNSSNPYYLHFDMTNKHAGTGPYSTNLQFYVNPEVDTLPVNVTVYVEGTALGIVYNPYVIFADEAFGVIKFNWNIFSNATLKYYLIKRDNVVVDSVTTFYCIDTLPDFGSYHYTVTPVYEEGTSSESVPAQITWRVPHMGYAPDTIEQEVWVDGFKIRPVFVWKKFGGELYYEFDGFNDPDHTQDFISMVAAYNGRAKNDNDTAVSYLTINAEGYSVGDYSTVLIMHSNEPDSVNTYQVVVNMHVSMPGSITGDISDCDNGSSLNGVKIEAMNLQDSVKFFAYSDATGFYHLLVNEGSYQLIFIKPGYDTITVDSVNTPVGITQVQSAELCLTTNMSGWVNAKVNDADDTCAVSWTMPSGPYEIIYDDGVAEDFFLFDQPGEAVALKFTPANYPVTVDGVMVYVGNGTETVNKTGFYHRSVMIGVLDDDGENGIPGTVLETVTVTVDNFGWIEFPSVFNVRIDSGDFYLAIWQLSDSVFSIPVGLDASVSENRSWFKGVYSGWQQSSQQGMMIRAKVNGPMQNVSRTFLNFDMVRFDDFDPDAGESPLDGTQTQLLDNTVDLSYIDADFGSLQMGWHAYGVKSFYETGESEWKLSNIVGHLMDVSASVSVEQCDSLAPSDAYVTFTGKNYPWDVYVKQTDTLGFVYFDSIIKGTYNIKIYKPGYQTVTYNDVLIMDDYTLSVILEENAFPARHLHVDSITSVATWDIPLITALPLQNFEDTLFPPEGWQVNGDGCVLWWRAGSSDTINGWVVPEWDGYYALSNGEQAGSCNNTGMGYLMTPALNLQENDDFKLFYDSYFEGLYGGSAQIQFSVDSGYTWQILEEIAPTGEWKEQLTDLSALSGENGYENVFIAFVYYKMNSWTGGWAIDNVRITSDPAPVKKYLVFLDGFQVTQLPPNQLSYTFHDLEFGHYYTASVRAGYSCGISEPIFYSWQSGYLYQPRNLQLDYSNNTDDVLLTWNLPFDNTTQTVPQGLLSFNIYRNNDSLTNIPYEGQQPDEQMEYFDMDLFPGKYSYKVTALYDLTHFGYPGETGESGPSNIETVTVKWGFDLPFEENWKIPDFNYNSWYVDTNYWKINEVVGNDAPSAMFVGDTTLDSNYVVSLSSVPFRGDKLDNELVYLDFDLRLDDFSSSGNETLKVEVYDGNNWNTLTTIANTGSFGFDEGAYHFDITNETVGRIFRVRFTATGSNPADAVWYVDNIKVYYKCKPPENLTGEYVWYNTGEEDKFAAKICWDAPQIPMCQLWLFWDKEENFTSIGLTDGGDFSVAARWEPDQIAGLYDDCITTVSFYLGDTGFDDLIIRIWKGENASNLIFEQHVANLVTEGWNTIVLNTFVPIDVTEELWVGYTIVGQELNKFPAGCDIGPAITGYGDKITTDGINWNNLSDYNLNYNWNIAARIEALPPEKISPLKPLIDDFIYSTPNAMPIQGQVNKSPAQSFYKSRDVELSSFSIYRSKTGEEGSYLNYATLPYEEGTSWYCFEDKYPNVEPQQSYWYKVTTVWIDNNTDTCESDFAFAEDNPDDDFVYVLVTDVENQNSNDNISLYPNPARDQLNIESADVINQITIYDYSGKIVLKKNLNSKNEFILNTATFHAGVYITRIKTEDREVFKRFVIVR